MTKLRALGKMDGATKRQVVCSLIGHSRIQTVCFGYYHCGRCGQQLGDGLGGMYDDADVVVVGHNCPTCRKNYATLRWQDKYLAPEPFKEQHLEGAK